MCPVNCFKTEDGVVLHDKDLCIGCGYCFYACPFGAPQFPQAGAFGLRGKMDKCTFCAGGPEKDHSKAEVEKYGRNRLAEGKLPACAEMCSTKALLAGDGDVLSDIYRERVMRRGRGGDLWGHATAYGRGRQTGCPGSGSTGSAKIMSKLVFITIGAAVALMLSACGEQPRKRSPPKLGTSAAKPDDKPYNNEKFNNDRATWEKKLRARADNQNEYKRVN